MKTYWVQYSYTYKYFGDSFGDFESGRFRCKKKDIPNEVEKRIKEELDNFVTDLKIDIRDCYETTDFEI